jgi:hypothetical protein
MCLHSAMQPQSHDFSLCCIAQSTPAQHNNLTQNCSYLSFPIVGPWTQAMKMSLSELPYCMPLNSWKSWFLDILLSAGSKFVIEYNHELGWSTKFLCREISRNIYFVFFEIIFLFSEISRNFVSRNITKFREISRYFCTKLKFSQGKIHFWILLHFNTTKKITFMSKVHKY